MSYYPYWLDGSPADFSLSIDDLGNNLLDMVSRYGKEVMIVVGRGRFEAAKYIRYAGGSAEKGKSGTRQSRVGGDLLGAGGG